MRREELAELHYITPIANVRSILSRGILPHNVARQVEHESIALQAVQDRRAKAVPGGRRLHDYVNLYIHARNPMMYRRRAQHQTLCVLRITTDVLDLPGVVVTECNASSDYVRYASAPDGLAIVDSQLAFAEWWLHNDPIEQHRRRSARCAEVLVPDLVATGLIRGAYVSCPEGLIAFKETTQSLQAQTDGHLFFR